MAIVDSADVVSTVKYSLSIHFLPIHGVFHESCHAIPSNGYPKSRIDVDFVAELSAHCGRSIHYQQLISQDLNQKQINRRHNQRPDSRDVIYSIHKHQDICNSLLWIVISPPSHNPTALFTLPEILPSTSVTLLPIASPPSLTA